MNPQCPRCGAGCSVKFGRFLRAEDAQSIQRYRCKRCGKCHSSATHHPTYRQKRRRLNRAIEVDLASSTSQRRIALKHRCARTTVSRKLKYLAERAREHTAQWLQTLPLSENVQWDELISFEHTRLKPLSVAVMSCVNTRAILGFGVASIPASGQIALTARKKYGKRPDRSASMRKQVLRSVSKLLTPVVCITTDEHPRYAKEIETLLPNATHIQHRSKRGSLTGQGELKRTGYDPLWSINHTLAMMRDNIKRLARKTWCTTKSADALADVIAVYVHYHNTCLIPAVMTNNTTKN